MGGGGGGEDKGTKRYNNKPFIKTKQSGTKQSKPNNKTLKKQDKTNAHAFMTSAGEVGDVGGRGVGRRGKGET